MSTISIQGLQQAPLPLLPTDTMIVSRGSNQDYKTTMQSVWTISTIAFPSLTSLLATDQMMVWRDGQPYIVNYSSVGFVSGTTMWFYSASAPSGWEIVALAGDTMLGIVDSSGSGQFLTGGSQLYNPSASLGTGTWAFSGQQIPSHVHPVEAVSSSKGNDSGFVYLSLAGKSLGTKNTNLSNGSQLGSWRPVTAIGVIAKKL